MKLLIKLNCFKYIFCLWLDHVSLLFGIFPPPVSSRSSLSFPSRQVVKLWRKRSAVCLVSGGGGRLWVTWDTEWPQVRLQCIMVCVCVVIRCDVRQLLFFLRLPLSCVSSLGVWISVTRLWLVRSRCDHTSSVMETRRTTNRTTDIYLDVWFVQCDFCLCQRQKRDKLHMNIWTFASQRNILLV